MSRPLSSTAIPPIARRILRPLERFLAIEAASGVVLLAAAVAALIWANSPGAHAYETLWDMRVTFGVGGLATTQSLHFFINDGLMTIFFLVVGLEIRREIHDGSLADPRSAMLPLAAALAGVLVPAILYLTFNSAPELRRGWAVPTATDIAFAVGVLALLGRRVPRELRVLLLTLAIVDDIIAILVIASVYSNGIALEGVLIAVCGTSVVLGFQLMGVQKPIAYVLPGCLMWIGLFRAGIHPTLAGVVLGLLAPATRVARVEATLHPWVAYLIMPLFAFANAGVQLQSLGNGPASSASIAWGVLLGLVLGKPIGIVLATTALVRLGWCSLPGGISWRHIAVLGCLGGIGFTMSIFIADLAFPNALHLAMAKGAVLAASAAAAIGGLILGRVLLPLPGVSDETAVSARRRR